MGSLHSHVFDCGAVCKAPLHARLGCRGVRALPAAHGGVPARGGRGRAGRAGGRPRAPQRPHAGRLDPGALWRPGLRAPGAEDAAWEGSLRHSSLIGLTPNCHECSGVKACRGECAISHMLRGRYQVAGTLLKVCFLSEYSLSAGVLLITGCNAFC